MKKILIAGMIPHDSGKTTTALNVLKALKKKGLRVGIAKPLSGFNGWYQYEYFKKSMLSGLLVGEDLYKLHVTANTSVPIEMEGPLVSLLLPPDIDKLGWRFTYYENVLENFLLQTILVRLTDCSKETPETVHYTVVFNEGKLSDYFRNLINDFFAKIKTIKKQISSPEELYVLLNENGPTIIDSCMKKIMGYLEENNTDILLIESFNDAIAPTRLSLETDFVIVVSPMRAAVYDGEDYRKAFEIIDGKSPWKSSTRKIIPLLKPRLSAELPPLDEKNYSKLIEKLANVFINE